MKIVQKILSHGLLIVFFVAVFFVYLYRGDLFPQWFDKQAQTEETPSAAAQSPVVGADESQPSQASRTDDNGQAAAHVPTAPAVESVEQPIVTEPVSDAAPAVADAQYRPVEPEEVAKETYNPVAEVPASVITAPEYRPLQTEKTEPPAAISVDAGSAGKSDFQSQLEQARQHYWGRDMPAAEQAYRRLTEAHPERAEGWGEFGNFFFSQREMVQATDAYYRAIELLIEQGDAERARQLLGTMYQLDAEKAKELETRLAQAGR